MKKICKSISGILICLLLLAGCGTKADKLDESAVQVNKDGTVSQTIIEPFDKPYYSKEDLQSMLLSETESYNKDAGEERVTVLKVALENGSAMVSMKYQSYKDYDWFNSKEFFSGTVKEAYENGFDLEGIYYSVADMEKTIGRTELLEMGESNIIITEEQFPIIVPGKITYVGKGILVDKGRTTAYLEEGEEPERMLVIY